jgi:hypothetical protein
MLIVAEDLMEDGTISRICHAYSLERGRRLPPTSEVKELQFVVVKNEIIFFLLIKKMLIVIAVDCGVCFVSFTISNSELNSFHQIYS